MAEIQSLCRDKGVMLIEDCALSFMSESAGKPLGTFGDYSIFCLYKTVPLPNGGVLVRNESTTNSLDELQLEGCDRFSVAGRSTELMLQWLRSHNALLGCVLFALKRGIGRTLNAGQMGRVPVGGTGFNISTASVAMSPICHMLLRRFQYQGIKEVRRRNFRLMQERLLGRVVLLEKPLDDGVCPLFFPLLVRDKASAARALRRQQIQTVEFWNHGDPEANAERSDAGFLRRHLLEVPIHQDVTSDAVDYMAEQILRLKVGLPA
jgi:dTDP-4-amino-4,6-dideoxygalactose transaminase